MAQKVRFPISLKLVLIFSLLVVAVLGVTTYMVSTLVRSDDRIKAEENNHTINGRTAVAVQDAFESVQKNAVVYFDTLRIATPSGPLAAAQNTQFANELFARYCARDAQTVFLYSTKTSVRCNPAFTALHPDSESKITSWCSNDGATIAASVVSSGVADVVNISPLFGVPVLCVAVPYKAGSETFCILTAFAADRLAENMSTGSYNASFLLNAAGDVLVHSDIVKMIAGGNLADQSAVQYILSSDMENSQVLLPDANGENAFHAFHRIPFARLLVVTAESERLVFEAINKTTYRIILFSLAVFFLAILVIRLFSKGITSPIGTLVTASHEIENGQFLLGIKPKTKDEIGVLTESFVQMGKGLAERERLKNTFSKFTNKAVAERALRGELALGGENRTATVFFSDIRSFTAISEKLTPQEVVEFLNGYMTRMVECINKNGGVVDKFIGDAIMAVWGAPESVGSPAEDAWRCVNTALMMRTSLQEFNKTRGDEKHPILKIGCGINTGDVVAGQIGSSERMEYTVIGDAVNLASRTESLNKPFATDILITEATYELVKDKVIVEEMQPVKVKGKEQPVRIFAVVNAVGNSYPRTLNDVRSELHIVAPQQKVDVNAEEQKYSLNV